MKHMIEKVTGNYSASASIVDGTLILSLPDAIAPVVWRLDLVHAKASALEVRSNEDGTVTLLLKTPRGDVNDIARFENRGRAVAALMSVTRAMESAHGQIRAATNDDAGTYNPTHLPVPVRTRSSKRHTAHQPDHKVKGWISGIAALALVIGLGFFLMNMGPRQVTPQSPTAGPSAQSGAPIEQSAGVAVSADDFLKNR